jgi:ubiquinone/menaquinone biosynthesis C-methylase UbiE
LPRTAGIPTDLADALREHWNARAAGFDAGVTHDLQSPAQERAWREAVARWTGPAPVDVLDVGCATGFFALLTASAGHRAHGVDLSPAMVEEARRKAAATGSTATFALGDATALDDVPDASVDVVLERHLMWTVPDPGAAVAEWVRVLRPGGLLVTVGVDWRDETRSPTHGAYAALRGDLPFYGGRPADDVVALHEAAGLREVRVESLHHDDYWLDGRGRDRYAVLGRRPG